MSVCLSGRAVFCGILSSSNGILLQRAPLLRERERDGCEKKQTTPPSATLLNLVYCGALSNLPTATSLVSQATRSYAEEEISYGRRNESLQRLDKSRSNSLSLNVTHKNEQCSSSNCHDLHNVSYTVMCITNCLWYSMMIWSQKINMVQTSNICIYYIVVSSTSSRVQSILSLTVTFTFKHNSARFARNMMRETTMQVTAVLLKPIASTTKPEMVAPRKLPKWNEESHRPESLASVAV